MASLKQLEGEITLLKRLVGKAPLLRSKDVMLRYGISKSTLHRWLAKGVISRPVMVVGPLWRMEDLEAVESRCSAAKVRFSCKIHLK